MEHIENLTAKYGPVPLTLIGSGKDVRRSFRSTAKAHGWSRKAIRTVLADRTNQALAAAIVVR